jgi:hypothetical protein
MTTTGGMQRIERMWPRGRILMSLLFNRMGVDMLVKTLWQELNYNLMFSQRGVR